METKFVRQPIRFDFQKGDPPAGNYRLQDIRDGLNCVAKGQSRANDMEVTVKSIPREWRDLRPGGLVGEPFARPADGASRRNHGLREDHTGHFRSLSEPPGRSIGTFGSKPAGTARRCGGTGTWPDAGVHRAHPTGVARPGCLPGNLDRWNSMCYRFSLYPPPPTVPKTVRQGPGNARHPHRYRPRPEFSCPTSG